jgi:hypothetical protein
MPTYYTWPIFFCSVELWWALKPTTRTPRSAKRREEPKLAQRLLKITWQTPRSMCFLVLVAVSS